VRNVFDLDPGQRGERSAQLQPLRLIALGTVEPRKNFVGAAKILEALRMQGFPEATLDIVGRPGWGDDWQALERQPGVTLHGYQSSDRVNQLLNDADIFICTSHDEGLGLPLLEAQYAGLPIIAPDAAIFREVLGESGLHIDTADPSCAAARITAALANDDWRARYVALAVRNLARWNDLARGDRETVISLIARLAA